MYVCVYVRVCVCMYVCMYVRTYLRTYVRMYACMSAPSDWEIFQVSLGVRGRARAWDAWLLEA